MRAESFSFSIGQFRGAALVDGAFNYPPDSLVANVPREQVLEELRRRGLPDDRIETPYTCLFVSTGAHRVLVDTGAGGLGALAAHVFPGLDHTTTRTGLLVESLRSLGIEPADIDTVIVSHAHPDHVGGTFDSEGRLVFSKARYFIAADELAFWMAEDAPRRTNPTFVDIARRNLDPLRGRLETVTDGDEIVPGVRAIATPGHTPGHIALAFESDGARLLHVSDAALYPLLIEHPDWRPVFDMDAGQADASKRMIFGRAAAEGALVFAHHFPPFPNLGYVAEAGQGWSWSPLVAETRKVTKEVAS